MPGQKLHASIAFYDGDYSPKAVEPSIWPGSMKKLVAMGKLDPNWASAKWKEVLEMDIFDYSQLPNIVHNLKSNPRGELAHMWAYRLTVMASTGN